LAVKPCAPLFKLKICLLIIGYIYYSSFWLHHHTQGIEGGALLK